MNGDNYYHTFDEANGAANMRKSTLGGSWYVKRHYKRDYSGEISGYWYSIHKYRINKAEGK